MSNQANIVVNDIAKAVSLVDANGNPISLANAMPTTASFSASSVAINDPNTTTQKMAVDASGNASVALGVALPAGTNAIGTVTANAGTGNFNNASVSTDGSAIPGSSTLIGASDGTNLQQLLVESATNRNLRTAIFNAANELSIDSNGVIKALLEVVSGTALLADQSNTELRVSAYVKTTNAGDTALTVGQTTMANSLPVTLASDQTPQVTSSKSLTNVSAAASDTSLLAANANRKGATFFNDGTAIMYLSLGSGAASTTSYTVQVPADGYWELPPQPLWIGAVHAIWSAANGTVRITELS